MRLSAIVVCSIIHFFAGKLGVKFSSDRDTETEEERINDTYCPVSRAPAAKYSTHCIQFALIPQ